MSPEKKKRMDGKKVGSILSTIEWKSQQWFVVLGLYDAKKKKRKSNLLIKFLEVIFLFWLSVITQMVVIDWHRSRNRIPFPVRHETDDPVHALTTTTDYWDLLMTHSTHTHTCMRTHTHTHTRAEQVTSFRRWLHLWITVFLLRGGKDRWTHHLICLAGENLLKGFSFSGIINLTRSTFSRLHGRVRCAQYWSKASRVHRWSNF